MFKKISLGDLILLSLEKSVDGFVRFDDFINNPYPYTKAYDRPLKKSALAQALKRLRERGYIEKIDKIDNRDETEVILKLTQLGQDFLDLSKSDKEIKWDGKWRIVVFDIPENKRAVRGILRNRLKLWGFTKWQQSVWASKKPVTEKFRQLVKDLKIEDWVLIFESDNAGR